MKLPPPDLGNPLARWAIARAGGWAGFVGGPIGFYDDLDGHGREVLRALYAFHDSRDKNSACPGTISDCYRLGCNVSGSCGLRCVEGQ